jgi:hippurate hydrolase
MRLTDHRRALHRIPELELRLPKTMEYLNSVLGGLGCRVFSPMESSLCAFFDFGADHAIAFRADCDALPIQERTGHDFPSAHPGCMHACGHDGHMAILLELARRLSKKKTLRHNVLLLFQPGEESPGGARLLCETGILDEYRVKAIFGLHLWPGLEKGVVFSRENELMSRSSEINVDFYGRSAHIGRSWEGIDALATAVEFYTRVTEMERALPESTYRLLKFGRFESGQVRNAISDHTRMEGSLRAFQDEVFDGMVSSIRSIAGDIEEKTGCRIEINMSTGYPAILNPSELAAKVMEAAPYRILPEPSMTSEDFSWYQRYVPGMFFFLGLGDTPALHSADFDFDEAVLEKGADYFLRLAEELP